MKQIRLSEMMGCMGGDHEGEQFVRTIISQACRKLDSHSDKNFEAILCLKLLNVFVCMGANKEVSVGGREMSSVTDGRMQ